MNHQLKVVNGTEHSEGVVRKKSVAKRQVIHKQNLLKVPSINFLGEGVKVRMEANHQTKNQNQNFVVLIWVLWTLNLSDIPPHPPPSPETPYHNLKLDLRFELQMQCCHFLSVLHV